MESAQTNFSAPLARLKDEVDALDLKITGCADEMNSLREYKDKYFEMKDKKKELSKIKEHKILDLVLLKMKKLQVENPTLRFPRLIK